MHRAASPGNVSGNLDEGTLLALTRTRLAAERTLMAWIRTSFSMISFGFTMGKFLQYLTKLPERSEAPMENVHTVPMLLILLGLISLFIGVHEFRRTSLELAATGGVQHRPAALGIVAVLVGVLGVLAFVGLFVRLR
jgi:putative membrane protein